jgi:hypothetical protein
MAWCLIELTGNFTFQQLSLVGWFLSPNEENIDPVVQVY